MNPSLSSDSATSTEPASRGGARQANDASEFKVGVHKREGRTPLGKAGRLLVLIRLFHPVPVLLTTTSGAVLAIVARPTIGLSMVARIVIVILLNQIAISLYNDVCDADLDAITHPGRAIPEGLIKPGLAESIAVAAGVLSVVIAATWGWLSMTLVLAATVIGMMYSTVFKRGPWSWVPFATGFALLPIWELNHLDPQLYGAWLVWVVAVPASVAIHLSDSIPDLEWDSMLGVRNLAIRMGPKWAATVARVLLASAGALEVALVLVPKVAHGSQFVYGVAAGLATTSIAALTVRYSSDNTLRYFVPAGAALLGIGWFLSIV